MFTEATGSSLGALAEAAEARFGDQSTLLFEGVELTSTQIGALGRRFATGLTSIGVRPGDRVAVCMANCVEVLASYNATWRIGAAVTPLLFLLSEDELRHALSDSGAAAVVTTPEFLPKVLAACAGLDTRCIVSGEPTDAALSFAELSAGAEASLVAVDPGEMAALLYTGGTTGRSKGVVLSHDAMSYAAWAGVKSGEDDGFGVALLPLPLAHAFGLTVSTLALHAVRPGRTVLMRWFDPAGWLQLAQDQRVEYGALVPTMLRLLTTQPLDDFDLSALRKLVSGSAPLPAEIAEQWARRLPTVEVVEGYGCSETSAIASMTPTGRNRPGSVGRAAPGVDIRIVGTEKAGADGEICIRTPSLMTGYWHDPDATAGAVRDGWFHTGDIGHLDDDGYLFIVDRKKYLIIRGGFNVYPRDIEDALAEHPDVQMAGVVGRPDPRQGEEVIAYVSARAGAEIEPAAVIEWARERIGGYRYPREVHVIDAIPLTPVGKVDRKALRARVVQPA
ncbi:MAG: class I adenylate-forming enzyme family protein [Jatrophihabitantaceae bacterium]